MEDTVRVLRIIEYVGPRSLVEEQIKKSIHGTRVFFLGRNVGSEMAITATTLGEFPEILRRGQDVPTAKE